jgi:hypothetical protein
MRIMLVFLTDTGSKGSVSREMSRTNMIEFCNLLRGLYLVFIGLISSTVKIE